MSLRRTFKRLHSFFNKHALVSPSTLLHKHSREFVPLKALHLFLILGKWGDWICKCQLKPLLGTDKVLSVIQNKSM
jgi:hypothetical protein